MKSCQEDSNLEKPRSLIIIWDAVLEDIEQQDFIQAGYQGFVLLIMSYLGKGKFYKKNYVSRYAKFDFKKCWTDVMISTTEKKREWG